MNHIETGHAQMLITCWTCMIFLAFVASSTYGHCFRSTLHRNTCPWKRLSVLSQEQKSFCSICNWWE